jgi:3-hexulose-6-phosphate synthase
VELQVALDIVDLDRAVVLAGSLNGSVERIEVGTPLILRHGVSAIRAVKSAAPDCVIVADCKTMDCGRINVMLAIEHGADGVIIQGAAPIATLIAATTKAAEFDKFIMVDDLGVSDLCGLALDMSGLLVRNVIIHTGKDEQARGATPAARLAEAAKTLGLPPLAVAGGIDASNFPEILGSHPVDVVIVGEAIYDGAEPLAEVERLRNLMTARFDRERVGHVGNRV